MPNLMQLEYRYVSSLFGPNDLHQSIQYINQLKCFKVFEVYIGPRSCTQFVQKLIENSIHIQHLAINAPSFDEGAIDALAQLKEMRILKIFLSHGLNDEQLIQIGQKMPNLEELHLDSFIWEENTTNGVKKMLKLANLSLLKMKNNRRVSIDVDDYKDILRLIQKRPNKKKLRIEIDTCGRKKNVSVPNAILKKTSDWLSIKEVNCLLTSFMFR